MIHINYPEPSFRLKKEDGKEFIFDATRKQWVVLTDEEWVRQNIVEYLVSVKKYPRELIALEKEMRLGDLKKRFDILVYNRAHAPWLMIECKASQVKLGDSVLQQLLRYNISIPVPYLVITNGHHCFGFERKEGRLDPLDEIPMWSLAD